MLFAFYKLKDLENIKEIKKIAEHLQLNVVFIKRENIDIDSVDEETFYQQFKDKKIAFIETWGDKFIHEVDLSQYDIIVFGAEDYGIDQCFIKKFEKYDILKIPIIKDSYNVVSSFVMVLTELKIQALQSRK